MISPVEETAIAQIRGATNPPTRILLVDDDSYVRELNAGVLIRFGYKVDTAGDGADAWKALNEGRYDLLITDNTMPRVTGMELIKKLRSEDMALPVILASGTVPVEELRRHPWLQLNATLSKPFTLVELLNTVKEVLSAAESARIRIQADFPVTTPADGKTGLPTRSHLIMKANKMPSMEKPIATPAHDQTNSSPRILVVDDEDDDRQLLIDVLIQSGHEVEAVKDGAAGWKALQAHDYDLIITDNKMPRVTGMEMIEKLRSARMGLPVIMVTGYLPAHEFVRKPWLKPDIILEKPFSNDDLLVAVKKLLSLTEEVSTFAELFSDCIPEENKIRPAGERSRMPFREPSNLHQRILVVDDDQATRQVSVKVLTGSGYEVEDVTDGVHGWEALQNNHYDLVITDNKMPRMTGVEMIAKLRSARMTLPVIMATGNLPALEFTRRPWLKPDAELQRPFSNDELLATVKKILGTDGGDDGQRETLLPKYL